MDAISLDDKRYIRMPFAELSVPRDGRICYANRWWAMTPEQDVLFFRTYTSPQCNANKALVERLWPGTTPTFISMAYVPHNCLDYI